MTVEQIEEACAGGAPPHFESYLNDAPALTIAQTFYPLGFPLEIRTNSAEVLRQSELKWGMFARRFDSEPIIADIHVVESDLATCPPIPVYRFFDGQMVMVADPANFCTATFPNGRTRMMVSTAALRHPNYFRQIFLDSAAACQIGTRFTTGVHAGCVALEGRGVLLCGDSGAGKTSLSWACARAGWDFLSDDTSYMIHGQSDRMVIGNCHQVRFRPSATELFPEIAGNDITPRIFGRPSIEVPTASMSHICRRESVRVDFIVFLNRRTPEVELRPYRKDVARCYMQQWLFGNREAKAVHYAAIERLLTAEVLELRYQCLDWAVQRLEQMVREDG